MEQIANAKAGFRSLNEAIDTTSPAGPMMLQMLGSFAEFERAMLRERTKAGLESARKQGRIGGRHPKLSPQQQAEIIKLVSKGRKTAADAARLFDVHPATVSRLLADARLAQQPKTKRWKENLRSPRTSPLTATYPPRQIGVLSIGHKLAGTWAQIPIMFVSRDANQHASNSHQIKPPFCQAQ